VGFLVGFFFLRDVLKKQVFFLVGSYYINPEDNYGRLIDSLRQISKLSYFNVLDLADFYDASLVSRFVSCANTVAHQHSVLAICTSFRTST